MPLRRPVVPLVYLVFGLPLAHVVLLSLSNSSPRPDAAVAGAASVGANSRGMYPLPESVRMPAASDTRQVPLTDAELKEGRSSWVKRTQTDS